MATPEEDRNVGIGLIVGGLFGGGLDAILFWVATSGPSVNVVLVLFASALALLCVYLIGYGIKKIATAGSMT